MAQAITGNLFFIKIGCVCVQYLSHKTTWYLFIFLGNCSRCSNSVSFSPPKFIYSVICLARGFVSRQYSFFFYFIPISEWLKEKRRWLFDFGVNKNRFFLVIFFMQNTKYTLRGFTHASATFLYVASIAWFLFNGKNFFGGTPSFLIPLFMLLLLVVSATITGLLVLGRPVYLYFNGFKKEAISLLLATLGWLILYVIILIVIILKFKMWPFDRLLML